MRKTVRIGFADFWPHFDESNNYFTNLLSKDFDVVVSGDPDFLIYSCYGNEHLNYRCFRIFYNGENLRVNWNACDYAFSFDYLNDPRHYRLPNWIWYTDPRNLLVPRREPSVIMGEKTGFCNMVVSNPHAKERIEFYDKLSQYKRVDSGGRYLNNIGGPVDDKMSFVSRYKFTIAFENSSYPGYTTEKLIEPMLADSVPIYWGNKFVGQDFNTASFVNHHDFVNQEAVIERIIELDRNDDLYQSLLKESWYNGNGLPACVDSENVLRQFHLIFSGSQHRRPAAQTLRRHFYEIGMQWQRFDEFLNRKLSYRRKFR